MHNSYIIHLGLYTHFLIYLMMSSIQQELQKMKIWFSLLEGKNTVFSVQDRMNYSDVFKGVHADSISSIWPV